jgi:hypothetical protein
VHQRLCFFIRFAEKGFKKVNFGTGRISFLYIVVSLTCTLILYSAFIKPMVCRFAARLEMKAKDEQSVADEVIATQR